MAAQPNAKRPYLSNALSNAAATEGLEAQLLRLADAAAAAGAADEAQHRQQVVAAAAAAAAPDADMYGYDDDTQDDAPWPRPGAGGGAYAAAVPLPPHAAAAAGAPVNPGTNMFAAAAGGVFHLGAAGGGMTVGQACELPSLHLKVALRTWAKLRFPGHHRDSGDHVLITDLLPDCSCYLTYLRNAVDKGLKAITARK